MPMNVTTDRCYRMAKCWPPHGAYILEVAYKVNLRKTLISTLASAATTPDPCSVFGGLGAPWEKVALWFSLIFYFVISTSVSCSSGSWGQGIRNCQWQLIEVYLFPCEMRLPEGLATDHSEDEGKSRSRFCTSADLQVQRGKEGPLH